MIVGVVGFVIATCSCRTNASPVPLLRKVWLAGCSDDPLFHWLVFVLQQWVWYWVCNVHLLKSIVQYCTRDNTALSSYTVLYCTLLYLHEAEYNRNKSNAHINDERRAQHVLHKNCTEKSIQLFTDLNTITPAPYPSSRPWRSVTIKNVQRSHQFYTHPNYPPSHDSISTNLALHIIRLVGNRRLRPSTSKALCLLPGGNATNFQRCFITSLITLCAFHQCTSKLHHQRHYPIFTCRISKQAHS